jgi:hypothetical protein
MRRCEGSISSLQSITSQLAVFGIRINACHPMLVLKIQSQPTPAISIVTGISAQAKLVDPPRTLLSQLAAQNRFYVL